MARCVLAPVRQLLPRAERWMPPLVPCVDVPLRSVHVTYCKSTAASLPNLPTFTLENIPSLAPVHAATPTIATAIAAATAMDPRHHEPRSPRPRLDVSKGVDSSPPNHRPRAIALATPHGACSESSELKSTSSRASHRAWTRSANHRRASDDARVITHCSFARARRSRASPARETSIDAGRNPISVHWC